MGLYTEAFNTVHVIANLDYVIKPPQEDRKVLGIFTGKPVQEIHSCKWTGADYFMEDDQIRDIVLDDQRRASNRDPERVYSMHPWQERFASSLRAFFPAQAIAESGFAFLDRDKIERAMKPIPEKAFIGVHDISIQDGDISPLVEQLPLRNLTNFTTLFMQPHADGTVNEIVRACVITQPPPQPYS